ncbi:MAG TPA: GNAT family N-acetyltransferase [Oscillospiraceae bacterium]|nr:GNAT family N-acetyltransferase [Oscillospiraceae bacterium]
MDYVTNENCITCLKDGEEVGEVTFPACGEETVVIDHTYVNRPLRGNGLADELVRRAADELRRTGRRARVTCSYARAWFREHPEYADVLER